MWVVDSPKRTAEEVARACAQGIKDPVLRAALLSEITNLSVNSETYQDSAAADTLHSATEEQYPIDGLSEEQLHWIYDNRLVRAKTPGRVIYDELISAAPFKLCAYCQYRPATTIDHFVPKAALAALSIEPWNLIPSCPDCNHVLGNFWSAHIEEQMLHPYFMPDLGRWLYASVEHSSPAVVRYYAQPASSLEFGLVERVRRQFTRLGLENLYAIVSAPELSGLERRLHTKFDNPDDVKAYLLEISSMAFAANSNDRRGVMYEALGCDEWYCRYITSG